MPVKTLVRTLVEEGAQHLTQKGTKVAAKGNWNKILKPLNSETIEKIPKEIADSQLKQIQDLAEVNPDAGAKVMADFENGVLNNEWDDFRVDLSNLEKHHSQDSQIAKRGIPIPEKDITPKKEELAGLREEYIASKDDTDHQRIIQDGLAQEEEMQSALAGVQRAKDRGSARGQDTYTRIYRQKKGTPGEYVEESAREWVEGRQEMQGRLVKRDAYGTHRIKDPEFPGKKPLSKPETAELKAREGLEALVEQHHIVSAHDSSVIADQLGKLGHRFKYNAYMYILKTYKTLPGDFDLNIANIPTGPHRLKSGNLHAWLSDMGFEDYWREFAKNNPGNPDPNKMMEALDLFFDEVFYPSLIKMDALVQQTPQKYEWKGLYIAPYLLKDAKARVKHLKQSMAPQNLRSTAGGKDVAIDQLHTMGAQAGEDTVQRTWETSPDGLPLMSREGFPKPKKSKKKTKK
mgnify:CR=1 FL=1|tara:strand:- start:42 stop:1421 length:1380 start_codon:yes stop_codon:yes gene_type:complete